MLARRGSRESRGAWPAWLQGARRRHCDTATHRDPLTDSTRLDSTRLEPIRSPRPSRLIASSRRRVSLVVSPRQRRRCRPENDEAPRRRHRLHLLPARFRTIIPAASAPKWGARDAWRQIKPPRPAPLPASASFRCATPHTSISRRPSVMARPRGAPSPSSFQASAPRPGRAAPTAEQRRGRRARQPEQAWRGRKANSRGGNRRGKPTPLASCH